MCYVYNGLAFHGLCIPEIVILYCISSFFCDIYFEIDFCVGNIVIEEKDYFAFLRQSLLLLGYNFYIIFCYCVLPLYGSLKYGSPVSKTHQSSHTFIVRCKVVHLRSILYVASFPGKEIWKWFVKGFYYTQWKTAHNIVKLLK